MNIFTPQGVGRVGDSVAFYKDAHDDEYAASQATYDALAAGGTGDNYYNLQLAFEGVISMYLATQDTTYIEICLGWAETWVSKGTITDSSGLKNWSGTWASPYSATNIAFILEDMQGATPMARTARIIITTPSLSAYVARATVIYNFVRDNIWEKNYSVRGDDQVPTPLNDTANNAGDKGIIWARIVNDLILTSAALGNADNTTYGWRSDVLSLANGFRNYNTTTHCRFERYKGGLTWDRGYVFDSGWTIDTSHANRVPFAMVELYRAGITFTMDDIMGVGDLLTKVIWDSNYPLSSPRFKNHIDGGNEPFLTRPAWNAGKIYDGWVLLALYHSGVFVLCDAMLKAILAGASNPSISYNDTAQGRLALPGHLAWAAAMRDGLVR